MMPRGRQCAYETPGLPVLYAGTPGGRVACENLVGAGLVKLVYGQIRRQAVSSIERDSQPVVFELFQVFQFQFFLQPNLITNSRSGHK
jgi:hypothetical protein